jgi:hypothetical protein
MQPTVTGSSHSHLKDGSRKPLSRGLRCGCAISQSYGGPVIIALSHPVAPSASLTVDPSLSLCLTLSCRLFRCLHQSAANDGYDPRKSKVSDERMDAWNNSVVTGDLNTVPGIGKFLSSSA